MTLLILTPNSPRHILSSSPGRHLLISAYRLQCSKAINNTRRRNFNPMGKIPVRFKRIAAAFDDDARARLCQSSGSEHSASSVTDLSDLVDSFLQGDAGDRSEKYEDNDARDNQEEREYQESENFCSTDLETKEMLINLIGDALDDEAGGEKRAIRAAAETACRSLRQSLPEGFKRRLMASLRQQGFDAGLCKSRWEKTGGHPAGEYEYIDVLISGTRYILEVSLATEFTIARPTKTYQSLLEIIPHITVIKPDKLKKVVRLMCAEIRNSLKKKDMLVSPWRRNGYMQAKWFGSYKRTTNEVPRATAYGVGDLNGKTFVGFDYSPSPAFVRSGNTNSYCRKEVGGQMHVGKLKAVLFSGKS